MARVFKLIACPGTFGVHSFIWVEITVLPSHFPPLQAAGRWFTVGGQWISRVLWAISKSKKSEPLVGSLSVPLQEFVTLWEYF